MGVDWKTKLPSGSATVTVELDEEMLQTARAQAAEEAAAATTAGALDAGASSAATGAAGATYSDAVNLAMDVIIQSIQGEDLAGRPLRVQRYLDKSAAKRRLSGPGGGGTPGKDSRYFSEDISCKCNNCGQVGHKQADCTNETETNPCHLCAGKDHEAGKQVFYVSVGFLFIVLTR
jgi:hypothetical protein